MSAPDSVSAAPRPLVVAFIGNPNTGKSTLFNALTGGKARIGNYPGVTVEKKIGRFRQGDREVQLIDLPGTYSLAPRSADEMVSVDVLLGRQADVGRPDAVVCIADASNLDRNLYLFSQIRDLRIPVVLVLNMWDIARARGIEIDLDRLRERTGAVVIATSAAKRQGIDEVRQAIVNIAEGTQLPAIRLFPDVFYREADALGDWLKRHGNPDVPFYLRERMLLDVHGESEHRASLKAGENLTAYLAETRRRLMEAGCRIPIVETKVRYDWIRRQLDGAVARTAPERQTTASDRIDRILTHKALGLLVFALLMFLIFLAIYSGAKPLMGRVEMAQTRVADLVSSVIAPGILRSLLVDGVVAGVGAVIVFLPQIALLFLFIALMEDCGYMARAAFLMDKLMTRIGLSGKSFLPLMSSFACAVPGIMATRVIENRRDRMVTILIAPLMSCSARLPVYLLMIGAFVPGGSWVQASALFAMYALGTLIAIPIAWVLKKTLFPGETPPFVMELPPYKWPAAHIVAQRVVEQAKAFIMRAGTLIFCVTVSVWAAGYFPVDHSELYAIQVEQDRIAATLAKGETSVRLDELQDQERRLGARYIRESLLGRAGIAIEPAVRPLGWDWRIGVGAIASFPAREVIIATMGTIFSLGGEVEDDQSGLMETLRGATKSDGTPLFTVPVAFSVMVFFALCAQCGATLMVIRRETNSWKWPAFTFVYMTILAYVGALLTYQIGIRILG